MEIGINGLNLIKKYEGLRLKPYRCPAGIPTIGYGTTVYPNNGVKVTMNDAPITEEQATEYLLSFVKRTAMTVDGLTNHVKITQNQFDALVSFAYNCGTGTLQKSSLLHQVLSNPNDKGIKGLFMLYDKANIDGRMTVINGLFRRRCEEADLYFK